MPTITAENPFGGSVMTLPLLPLNQHSESRQPHWRSCIPILSASERCALKGGMIAVFVAKKGI